MEAVIEVSDLHAVTPSEYIAFAGAYLHPTSYQQARHFNVPLNTIYVAQPGYMLGLAAIENGSILRENQRTAGGDAGRRRTGAASAGA